MQCFIIQPFDGGRFDKRYEDVFKPAIEAAGMQPYRVDRDHGVRVPIESIESGIRNSTACLADITTDNPNVWYELGFASALSRPVIMVCSDERAGSAFPFDIQHKTVTRYKCESPRDFESLAREITSRLKSTIRSGDVLDRLNETEAVAPVEGLTQCELAVLASLVSNTTLPSDGVVPFNAQSGAERSGFTKTCFSIGVKRLLSKRFIESGNDTNSFGEPYTLLFVTDLGWDWVERNEDRFVLNRHTQKPQADDDIPF